MQDRSSIRAGTSPDGTTTQAWLQTGEACASTRRRQHPHRTGNSHPIPARSVQPRRSIRCRLRPHDPGHHPDRNHPRRPPEQV